MGWTFLADSKVLGGACCNVGEEKKEAGIEPDVNRTRNLLIWSQTRYHCATDPHLLRFLKGYLIYNIFESQQQADKSLQLGTKRTRLVL